MKTKFFTRIGIVCLSLLLGTYVGPVRAQETPVIDYTASTYWENQSAGPQADAGSGLYSVGAIPLTVTPAKRKLGRIGFVVAQSDSQGQPNQGHLDTMEWRAVVWSSQAAFFADPLHGDVGSGGFEVQFNHPTNAGYMNPIAGGQVELFPGYFAYYIETDLRSANVILTPGHQYFVGLVPVIDPLSDGYVMAGLVQLGGGNPNEPWLVNTVGYPSPEPFSGVPWVGPDGETPIGMRNAQALKVTVMPHTKALTHHQSPAIKLTAVDICHLHEGC